MQTKNITPMYITFNELRRIKDTLPPGSMKAIANQLHLTEDTVRNYFGASHYQNGESAGLRIEQGPDGGVVELVDDTILNLAREMIRGRQ